MICPSCGKDNIPGEDYCARCSSDLRSIDIPMPEEGLAAQLMNDTVKSMEPPAPITLSAEDTVWTAVKLMREKRYGSVLICEDNKLMGIFTERDLLRRVLAPRKDVRSTRLGEVMTPRCEKIEESAPIAYALNKMSVQKIRHLPVTRKKAPIGFISVRGMLRYLAGTAPH